MAADWMRHKRHGIEISLSPKRQDVVLDGGPRLAFLPRTWPHWEGVVSAAWRICL
jgi:hypothetical protein